MSTERPVARRGTATVMSVTGTYRGETARLDADFTHDTVSLVLVERGELVVEERLADPSAVRLRLDDDAVVWGERVFWPAADAIDQAEALVTQVAVARGRPVPVVRRPAAVAPPTVATTPARRRVGPAGWSLSVVVWLASLTVDVFSSVHYISQRDEPIVCGSLDSGISYPPFIAVVVLAGYALRRVHVHAGSLDHAMSWRHPGPPPEHHARLLRVVAWTIIVAAAVALAVFFVSYEVRPHVCLD